MIDLEILPQQRLGQMQVAKEAVESVLLNCQCDDQIHSRWMTQMVSLVIEGELWKVCEIASESRIFAPGEPLSLVSIQSRKFTLSRISK
jgi:hypothetical protein